jgi:hypothetical protein
MTSDNRLPTVSTVSRKLSTVSPGLTTYDTLKRGVVSGRQSAVPGLLTVD